MKRIMAIIGSSRKNGNTEALMEAFLEGVLSGEEIIEVERFRLADMDISPCRACGACEKTGACVINDDMQIIYDSFRKCDGLVIASPLYFGSVSALVKAMVDRCQMFWSSQYVLGRPSIDKTRSRKGFFIATGGAPFEKDSFAGCHPVMDLFFKAVGVRWEGSLEIAGTDNLPVFASSDVLEKAGKEGVVFFNPIMTQ
jgi:FMN-dependent NADH-azoreductase